MLSHRYDDTAGHRPGLPGPQNRELPVGKTAPACYGESVFNELNEPNTAS